MGIRRAEWQVREGERWTIGRVIRLDIWQTSPLLGFALVCSVLCLLAAWVSRSEWFLLPALITPLAVALLPWRPVSHRIRNLAPQPSDVPQHPVIVKVSHKSISVGSDEGVLTFVDGWMHFEGFRMSFSIRPRDIHRVGWKFAALEGLRVDLEDSVHGTSLVIRPLTPYSELSRSRMRGFRLKADFKAWKDTPGIVEGEPVYPPVTVHPMAVIGWRMNGTVLVAVSLCFAPLFILSWLRTGFTTSFWTDCGWLFAYAVHVNSWVTSSRTMRSLTRATPNLPALDGHVALNP